MEWFKNFAFVSVFLIKILHAYKNFEDTDVSVDIEIPRIKGWKLDIFGHNSKPIQLKWQLGIIPYYIDLKTYDAIINKRIRAAMNTIEGASCILFKPMKDIPKLSNGTWLHFTNPKKERDCFHETELGENGELKVILGFECMHRREVLHSVLHALGFKDEVSHPQRDQYIRIVWQNIQPKYRPLFRIQLDEDRTKTLVEYDPMSVMHFHDRAFTANGGATIAPLVPGLVINPSENLSQLDKMKLRLYFGRECNKRKVGDILDTCKKVLHDSPSAPKQEALLQEINESASNDSSSTEY